MNIQHIQWNREDQRVIFSDSGLATEALITFSRTTLGGRIKHYGIFNDGNIVVFYEEDIIQEMKE